MVGICGLPREISHERVQYPTQSLSKWPSEQQQQEKHIHL